MLPPACPSPSKKLLITEPKPKSDLISASSSSATSPPPQPPEKRTRDQPNLSDCHGCGCRINFTNPKDRLQPLDSVWRIVLLCVKCRKNIKSGRTCPYCFKGNGNSGDYCICSVCARKIHKKCVSDYGNCTPWCYLGAGLEGFRVCVDCWVPELLKNSIRVKAGSKDKGEARDLTENVVQEAKSGAEKKIKRVSKAKENVSRTGSGEMNAEDVVEGAFDLLAKKDVDGSKGGNSNCSGAVEVVDDAALAIHLHRAINSSPRISRGSKSLVNLDSSDAIGNWKGLFYKRSGLRKKCSDVQKIRTCFDSAENGRMSQSAENDSNIVFGRFGEGLLPYKRDRKRKVWQPDFDNNVVSESASSQQAELGNLHSDDAGTRSSMKSGADRSEDSVCVSTDKNTGDRFRQEFARYKRTRFRNKVCQVSGTLGVSSDSNYFDNIRMVFNSDYCQPDNANLGTGCPIKGVCEVILPSRICEAKHDRYHLKYVKRIPGSKRDSNFLHCGSCLIVSQAAAPAVSNSKVGYPMNSGELILPDGTCNQKTDRYSVKYTKRAKRSKSGSTSESELNSDVFLTKLEAATGLTKNCSAESRTLSDVSFDSFPIDLPK